LVMMSGRNNSSGRKMLYTTQREKVAPLQQMFLH
jgi:hypothetical protein